MEYGDEIIKVLDYLGEKIGVTIDWTNNNVLPYVETLCNKYVMWETNTSIAWIGIMIAVLMIILIACLIIHVQVKKSDDEDDEELEFWAWIIFAIAVIIAFIVIGVQVFDIVECQTFPEKVIYDYIKTNISINSKR